MTEILHGFKSPNKLEMLHRETSGENFQTSENLPVAAGLRPRIHGKFFFCGAEKFYLRGVTYGTFDSGGDEYNPKKVALDFALMAKNGINTVRVYTVPPVWLLDAAAEHDLRVMIGLPWEQHLNFLDDSHTINSIETRLRRSVQSCAAHPAVLCFAVGNEIPASIVRWYGRRRIEKFLHRLYKIVKSADQTALVTYVNFPSTEYLNLPFVDFVCFNVYLEKRATLAGYLARLQNVAGDKPLVMAEIGLDSRRNGLEKQAATLDWQVRTAFAAGCAGAFVFAWTDEWHRGGAEIEDWDFGLTTRRRTAKPALETVKNAFAEIPFPAAWQFPKISVVVCSYNGEPTIRDCLEGLLKLDYPDFEVIIVNDGSTDNTPLIAAEYPQFQIITTPNCGLSSARNTGLAAARGEIVAYTDDDAHPDPHWLKYLAASFLTTDFVGIGGPNIAPRGDGEIAECVANAPGGPIHVLLGDTEAEHIPGCNMAFRREALREIGGFDVQYRHAGDDVDVCWRIRERGWKIGFSPAAMVWHHRRNSILDYWKQQKGYGKAEALLERKWAEKYNAVGHLTWEGKLYGRGLTRPLNLRRGRIYQGVWGSALFQAVYHPATGWLESLPLMPEWYFIIAVLGVLSALDVVWLPLIYLLPLLVLAVFAPLGQAILSGFKATFQTPPKNGFHDFQRRLITSFLHLIQPLARLRGRLTNGLTPWRRRGASGFALPLPQTFVYWSENWRDSSARLCLIENELRENGAIVQRGGDFDNHWDLFVRGGMFGGSRLLTLVEEHGQGKQLIRVHISPKMTHPAVLSLVIAAVLSILAVTEAQFIAAVIISGLGSLPGLLALLEMGYTTDAIRHALRTVQTKENGIVLTNRRKETILPPQITVQTEPVEIPPETESV